MSGSNRNTCAVCHNDISAKTIAERPITGGICVECLERFRPGAGTPLLDFLDLLNVPVLVTDSDVVVSLANRPLQALLGKNLDQMKGQRGGDVFECAYAHLPQGCGKTTHCSGCAIRRAVMDTFLTGKSHRDEPARLNRDAAEDMQLGLIISTEKQWGMVLLRIDHIGPLPEGQA
ncbi:MAG: hypothetical protein LLG01_13845 [Planctomycetaceae bacterium]|nr:hypothetical protein [Planctomycetaceae bacterium]